MPADDGAAATPAGKLEQRLANWLAAPGISFATLEAAAAYEERVRIIRDAIQLRIPTRIPLCPHVGAFPARQAGISVQQAMYDYAALGEALRGYHREFLPDSLTGAAAFGSGPLLETLDYRLYRWAGHGIPADASFQCVESEYMRADEYTKLIDDPSNFFLRSYLPRVLGVLEPWQKLGALTDILEIPMVGGAFVPFGLPELQDSLQRLQRAGQQALEWFTATRAIDVATIAELGIAPVVGGMTKAPFDTIGDTLRGTHAVALDLFRRPAELLAALERLVPLAIEMGVRAANRSGRPVVFIPLHKGADGFMSDKAFRRFYWPTLKAVILGLVAEGVVPYLFVEGAYNRRLDVIADPDIPAGTTLWMFDQTDLTEVRRRFHGWACFGGNVPLSLLAAGTPPQVSDHVKRLIDTVGRDGGYILSTGAVIDDAVPANVRAMFDTAREYGRA